MRRLAQFISCTVKRNRYHSHRMRSLLVQETDRSSCRFSSPSALPGSAVIIAGWLLGIVDCRDVLVRRRYMRLLLPVSLLPATLLKNDGEAGLPVGFESRALPPLFGS